MSRNFKQIKHIQVVTKKITYLDVNTYKDRHTLNYAIREDAVMSRKIPIIGSRTARDLEKKLRTISRISMQKFHHFQKLHFIGALYCLS